MILFLIVTARPAKCFPVMKQFFSFPLKAKTFQVLTVKLTSDRSSFHPDVKTLFHDVSHCRFDLLLLLPDRVSQATLQ